MHRTRKATSETISTTVKPAAAKATKPGRAVPRMAKPAGPPAFDREMHRQEIAVTAYQLWLARGEGQGSAAEDWARAEIIVQLRYSAEQRASAADSE